MHTESEKFPLNSRLAIVQMASVCVWERFAMAKMDFIS